MISFFGIRHHGPGSARSLLKALEQLHPDVILIEGPPDAGAVIPLLADNGMKPPVALLVYNEADPSQAAYYPFAAFSPEYNALSFALRHNIPVRFMDLPQRLMFPLRATIQPDEQPFDPLSEFARSAGYDDAERWWDSMVEQRQDTLDLFEAIHEAMSVLREALGRDDPLEVLREAYMRKVISQAQCDGFQRIAVVCGAWHTPGLQTAFSAEDETRLAALEQVEVAATWVPWTYSRLARRSGYGAGVESPGWYEFLWNSADHRTLSTGWLTKVAQHLRGHDLDASTAQVIDAAQLVETLVAMRGRALPDLHDLNEAALSVMCHGNEAPMQLIQRDLIIGKAMGRVPNDVPMVPLQRDFHREIERLGLPLSDEESDLMLDLREGDQRETSFFLHRLLLLQVELGKKEDTDAIFEMWTLQWQPASVIQLIEKSVWGTSLVEAASAYAIHRAHEANDLPELTQLVHDVLFADLPLAVPGVVKQLENEAAATGDIGQLMTALPSLVNVLIYGDVRRTEVEIVRPVVDGFIVRILIGLPAECIALDDDAAAAKLDSLIACDYALRLLENADTLNEWHSLLYRMIDQDNVHALIRGRCCRVVVDAGFTDTPEAVRQLRLALARVVLPVDAAAWLRGFLKDSGIILVHDEHLLDVIDEWLTSLLVDDFEMLLPLLRRTFATFEEPELKHIGRRIEGKPLKAVRKPVQIDADRAASVDATFNELLGGDIRD